MPYPRAYLFIAGLLALTVPAFWPNYFSQIASVSWPYHVHAITASLWLMLVISQSWSIHHDRLSLHRTAGLASLVLAPLFLAGGLIIVGQMAVGGGPFRAQFGPPLATVDLIAVAAFAGLFYGALRHRRSVELHARYILATPLLLLGPIFARLIASFVPGLTIRTVEEMPRFAYAMQLSQLLAVVAALWLYFRSPQYGRPFAIVAVVAVLQSLTFEFLGQTRWWGVVMDGLAAVPPWLLGACGLGLGVIAAYLGWTGPRRSQARAARATSPAE